MISANHRHLHSAFERITETLFFGYVLDPQELHRRFVVEILLDGVSIKLLRAEQYDPQLRKRAFGDGCYAFEFAAKPTWLDRHHLIEARVANTGELLADAILLSTPLPDDRTQVPIGAVSWSGGIRLSGWARGEHNRQLGVRALEGDALLSEVQLDRWAHVETEDKLLAGRIGFELWLPEALADGKIHRIRVTNQNDVELVGSPVSILAFCDGLQSFLARTEFGTADKLRLEFFEKLMPMSLPFSCFAEWQKRFPLPPPSSQSRVSAAVVLVGNGDSENSLASLHSSQQQWTAVVLPQAETVGDAFDPTELIDFLNDDGSDCAVIAFARSGTLFEAQSLSRFTELLNSNPRSLIAYGDVAVMGQDGRSWPAFFPTFDYERFLEQGYAASWFALRRETVLSVLPKRPTTLFRLFNAVLDGARSEMLDRVVHLPGVSASVPMSNLASSRIELAQATRAHLEATGVEADIDASASSALFPGVRVRRRIGSAARVAIIIPTRNRVDLLKPCVESVERSAPNIAKELIIVDNDSSDEETKTYLHHLAAGGAKVLEQPGPFNYSRLINRAVELTSVEYICLLNNDVQAIESDWLSELLSRAVDPSVGAVGAMLLWPNDIVQHGGIVLGPYFGAAHAFNDRIREDPGYCDLLHVARECSALTAACLLLRRSDYLAVGGLDEVLFPVNFNDVDLCLKLRARGYRIVFTPHTALLHFGSATRGPDHQNIFDPERAGRERAVLHARWGEAVANDPFYSPQLNLDATPYSGLAWPPRSHAARTRLSAVPIDIPAGF
jgi:GT2 family glycosyltransferase